MRKAMGASWQFTKPVLLAILLALPVAALVMRWWLAGFAYRVGLAPWTFAAVAAGALVIAWATVFAHALMSRGRSPSERSAMSRGQRGSTTTTAPPADREARSPAPWAAAPGFPP